MISILETNMKPQMAACFE